jgi:formylglycine-generating enzyme required for sulfatase activity
MSSKTWLAWSLVILATGSLGCSKGAPWGKDPETEISLDLGDGATMDFVLIPAGEFLMGDEELDNEKPIHKVAITKCFYLGKYEVTQEQWRAVMGQNPSAFKGARNPVENVSWIDCQKFLEKLNARHAAPGERFVLPTEAQWEYACRAGATTCWSFGDDEKLLGDYAWMQQNSGETTHPVGEKKPNAWGLYDMHGNVWEWCADWYGERYYQNPVPTDPTGPSSGQERVLRGGAWKCAFHNLFRCAYRCSNHPGQSDMVDGFRVAKVLIP